MPKCLQTLRHKERSPLLSWQCCQVWRFSPRVEEFTLVMGNFSSDLEKFVSNLNIGIQNLSIWLAPHFNYPTHTLNIFPTLLVGIPCCLSRTSGTYTPAAVVPHPYTFNSQFVGVQVGRLFNTLRPYHTLFNHRLRSFGFTRVYRSYCFGFVIRLH